MAHLEFLVIGHYKTLMSKLAWLELLLTRVNDIVFIAVSVCQINFYCVVASLNHTFQILRMVQTFCI